MDEVVPQWRRHLPLTGKELQWDASVSANSTANPLVTSNQELQRLQQQRAEAAASRISAQRAVTAAWINEELVERLALDYISLSASQRVEALRRLLERQLTTEALLSLPLFLTSMEQWMEAHVLTPQVAALYRAQAMRTPGESRLYTIAAVAAWKEFAAFDSVVTVGATISERHFAAPVLGRLLRWTWRGVARVVTRRATAFVAKNGAKLGARAIASTAIKAASPAFAAGPYGVAIGIAVNGVFLAWDAVALYCLRDDIRALKQDLIDELVYEYDQAAISTSLPNRGGSI